MPLFLYKIIINFVLFDNKLFQCMKFLILVFFYLKFVDTGGVFLCCVLGVKVLGSCLQAWKKKYVMLCAIWYHLYNLKNVRNTKHPWRSVTFGKVAGFSRFLNCTNDTKLRNASQMQKAILSFVRVFQGCFT